MSLELENASYSYTADKPAVRGVSIEVPDGALCCLVGATGSGKSTLVKMACGLLRPHGGSVSVDGAPVWQQHGLLRRERRDPSLFRRVGYVMQRPERQLFAETVLEDAAFGPENLGDSAGEARDKARAALDELGIAGLADRSPFELSGGQQRLAAIAGVLAMGPANLVMDEPMGSLDPHGRDIVREAVKSLHDKGRTVLLVTHDMNDVALLADRAAVMHDGSLMLAGSPDEVFAHGSELHAWGLGVPDALAEAQTLSAAAGVDLGSPLTIDGLADKIAGLLAGGEDSCA